MNKQILEHLDILAIDYVSLKGITNEVLSEKNPIFRYYNEKLKMNFLNFDNLLNLSKNIDKLSQMSSSQKMIYFLFGESKLELTNDELQSFIEYCYKMYIDLDNLSLNVSDINSMFTEIFGDLLKTEDIIEHIKTEYKNSFHFILNNTTVESKNFNHIKIKLLQKDMEFAILKEDYIKAANIRDQIKSLNS